ncbi:hypothetical protein [Hymenobacter terricola]|uniref:hypothetical protein n=1 Tax=Hymenobacter terricola TaxID=2819236 RepID=UPI001B30A257|nr:hypothetical protein [Hymenobacter terricola]
MKVLGRPAINVAHQPTKTLYQDGRYYVAGGGDGSGTGQRPLALHYSLVCLDTAGTLRWQRQYLNPAIRLDPANPAYVGGYAYLWQVLEAPRRGLLLFGDTQRDSIDFQFYAIETDSAGRPRRTRWVEPFGRRADVVTGDLNNMVRLRDGSGYVITGYCRLDSLNRQRVRGFVAKIDTSLRVVWRTLLPAPTAAGPADPTADIQPGQVRERADGGLSVMVTEYATNGHPRVRQNEFDLVRLSPQGRVLGWDTYCSQTCTQVTPSAWQYLPDSSVVVSGWGQQRNAATGRLLAQPAWLARLGQPCRRYVVQATPTAAMTPADFAGLALYPQPARAGAQLHIGPAGTPGLHTLRLVDALGREVARLAVSAQGTVVLPAALRPGLYGVQRFAAGQLVARHKLVVLAAE